MYLSILLIFTITIIIHTSFSLDIYSNVKETYTITGINAQMYYLKNSVVNKNAVQFRAKLSSRVSHLTYSVRSDRKMNLTLTTTSGTHSDSTLVHIPSQQIKVIRVLLPCFKNSSDFIHVNFMDRLRNLNMTLTYFKHCVIAQKLAHGELNLSNLFYGYDSNLIGALIISVFIICVFCSSIIFYIHKSKKNDKSRGCCCTSCDREGKYDVKDCYDYTEIESSSKFTSSSTSVTFTYEQLLDAYASLEITESRISLRSLLYQGGFGNVHIGRLRESNEEICGESDVIVKTLSDGGNKEHFLCPGTTLLTCDHPNISQVTGCCLTTVGKRSSSSTAASSSLTQFPDSRCMLIYQPPRPLTSGLNNSTTLTSDLAMDHGDGEVANLKRFLQARSFSNVNPSPKTLSGDQRLQIISSIIEAVSYLHSINIIHKDIATRNCIVKVLSNEMLHVCLSDGVLATDLFPEEYSQSKAGVYRPIRWMALECIAEDKFSNASDVWSLGITLWEIYSMCLLLPYSEVTDNCLEEFLLSGNILSPSTHFSQQESTIIPLCLKREPKNRIRLNDLSSMVLKSRWYPVGTIL